MRISNCQLAFSLLQAAGLAQSLADAGIDADDPRVQAYCDKMSAATSRPIRDILDLTIREAIALRAKVQNVSSVPFPAQSQQPGRVIPGCTDTKPPSKSKRGEGLRAPGQ